MTEARRLDPTQRAAAAADAPVQLTLAGPGAGKTTTLAVRFVHLVRQGVDPRRILAVTFTRKAAIEMQDRIVRLLRLDGPKGLAVDTFHAFAFRHLRRQPQRFGLPEQFDLWDVLQQRHVFHARRMWWNEEIDIIDLIGGMKERLIDAAGFARMVGDKSDELRAYYPAAVEFFNVYEAALRDAGAIDFADMVPLVTRAMAHDTACRSAITGAFDHMLVDEYQDVNPGQLDLIAHFVAAGVKLWAVGDDDQTLYAFRASDIRTILDFGRHHPGARIHTLEVNYRAGAAIVDAAKALIRHNRTRVDKDYRPVLTEPGEIVIRGYSSPEIEARQVAAAIAELLGQGEAPGQITILYRAGAIGLNFQTALKERQIPFEVRGSGDLWQSVGARLVVGALHYLHGGATVAAMSRLGTGQRSRIIVEHLDQIRPTVGHDFTLSCPHVERIVGEALPAKASDRERNEWTSLVQSVVSVAVSCASLAALERRIAEQSAALRAPPDEAVVLSTVHSAKGLEWDTVFLVGMEEGVLPSANAEDLEEERRIAYVGVTRARRGLGLTYSAHRYGVAVRPSRFLSEIKTADWCICSGPKADSADDRLPVPTEAERRRLRSGRKTAATAPPERPPRTDLPHRTPQSQPEQRLREQIERNLAARRPLRHGLPWSLEEVRRLKELFSGATPLDRIARELQRSEGGVLAQLVRMGVLSAPDPGQTSETLQYTSGHPEPAEKV